VELVVGAGVARVELLLDGDLVGERTGPPWEISCDFGEELAPHELVAVARDAKGEEVGRARQWINLPDPENSRAHVGHVGTAVAVELGQSDLDLEVEALAGHFIVDGRPVRPVSVEKGLAEVVVVMDREARPDLRRIADLPAEPRKAGRPIEESPQRLARFKKEEPERRVPSDRLLNGGESVAAALAARQTRFRAAMRLGEGQLVSFLWLQTPEPEYDAVRPDLFSRSRALPPSYGGMLWFLSEVYQPIYPAQEQRVADAVAAAGMAAAASGRRRAVVLILGDGAPDASLLSPPAVRQFLQDLGVPLHVWAAGPVPDEVAEAWGSVRKVPKKRALKRAVKELSKSLERQQVVWVEGLHLPQDVALTGAADDLRLVR